MEKTWKCLADFDNCKKEQKILLKKCIISKMGDFFPFFFFSFLFFSSFSSYVAR